ncbi:MAG: hypothetical protein R3E26_10570 [Nitrosomonas sp.]
MGSPSPVFVRLSTKLNGEPTFLIRATGHR